MMETTDFGYITTNKQYFMGVVDNVLCGRGVKIYEFVNLYGCEIGDDTSVGAFTEIGKGVKIGKRCKIGAHVFIPPGVTIGDGVFIGPGVIFTNDRYPRATNLDGSLQTKDDWKLLRTEVKERASIGAGAIVLPGLCIGREAMIGAGTIVLRDVEDHQIVYGTPNRYGKAPDEHQ